MNMSQYLRKYLQKKANGETMMTDDDMPDPQSDRETFCRTIDWLDSTETRPSNPMVMIDHSGAHR
jgi:hypothetical protein